MKYIKLYESHTKYKYPGSINWDMIENIKDMSLEYLDDNYALGIYVYSKKTSESIYRMFYTHQNGVQEDWRLKATQKPWSNSDKLGQIFYRVLLYNISDRGSPLHRDKSNELRERILMAYPSEDIEKINSIM